MLRLLFGLQINSMAVLLLKRNFRNGLVKLVQIFPFSSLVELHTVLVEVRYDAVLLVQMAFSGIFFFRKLHLAHYWGNKVFAVLFMN